MLTSRSTSSRSKEKLFIIITITELMGGRLVSHRILLSYAWGHNNNQWIIIRAGSHHHQYESFWDTEIVSVGSSKLNTDEVIVVAVKILISRYGNIPKCFSLLEIFSFFCVVVSFNVLKYCWLAASPVCQPVVVDYCRWCFLVVSQRVQWLVGWSVGRWKIMRYRW